MGIVIKLAILIFCIRHLLNHGQPVKTAIIYAGSYFCIGIVLGLVGSFTLMYGIALGGVLLYDFLTGFVLFWLLDRHQNNSFLFYFIIIMGLIFSLGVNFALKYYMLTT